MQSIVISIQQKHQSIIGPLQDTVTWCGVNYARTQITQWDFQNKGKSGWTGKSSFVLNVPLRYLRRSIIYSVTCDRIVQRAHYFINRCHAWFSLRYKHNHKLNVSENAHNTSVASACEKARL